MGNPLVQAPIESVLVFRRGARVTRRLSLDDTTERLRIGPLPMALADGTVRVRATGARVRAATVSVAVPEPAETEGRPARNEALERARIEEGAIEARLEVVRASLQALDALELVGRGRVEQREPGAIPTGARRAAATLRRELHGDAHARLRTLEEELRVAREERQAFEQEDRIATAAKQVRPHELRKALDVVLDEVGSEAELRIEYDVADARWYPVYTLRFDDAYEQARMEVRALLAQRTGEDWADARLTCSTALPDRQATLPELRSIRLGRAQPAPPRAFRELPDDIATLFADFERGYPTKPEPPVTRSAPLRASLRVAKGEAQPPPRPAPPPPRSAGSPPPQAAPFQAAPPAPKAPAPSAAPRGRKMKRAVQETGRFASVADEGFGAALGLADMDVLVGGGGGPFGGAPKPDAIEPEPMGLAVADGLLDYAGLTMADPTDPARGKLRRATDAERLGVPASVPLPGGARSWTPRTPPRTVTPAPIAGFDHAYVAPGATHVPSDGAFHTVALQVHEGAARRHYVVVPRESRDVFRTVALEPLGAPLLPGPLDVYVGDRFLTSRSLDATPAGDALELGLGVEAALEVARNASFSERTTGLMRGGLALEHEVSVDLENHLRQAAEVEVRERLPVAREGADDVEVKVEEVSPRWEPWTPEPQPGSPELRGGHRWIVKLAPAGQAGARARLELRYAVHISGKQQLVGGNRRES